jgi:hypothetical protein
LQGPLREGITLLSKDYVEARELSEGIARAVGSPRFYIERHAELERSQALFDGAPLVEKALRLAAGYGDCLGHGQSHVRKVAIDTGALVLIEGAGDPDLPRLVLLAHLAGLLHDIKRSEKDHAHRGAEEAALILKTFPLRMAENRAITQAIGNHEAFRTYETLADPRAELLSNALYDADKFRWGPDNFTETVWAMVAPRRIPLRVLMAHFLPGLEGVRRIRETFRTPTGRRYGPDFIDRGLEIGRRLHEALMQKIDAEGVEASRPPRGTPEKG